MTMERWRPTLSYVSFIYLSFLGVRSGQSGWGWRPELAAAEKTGVPARGAPHVARARAGVHVHAAQAEAQPVGEEELVHVQERPHEVAPRVRPVPAFMVVVSSITTTSKRSMTNNNNNKGMDRMHGGMHSPYGEVQNLQVVLQELGPGLVVVHDRAGRVGGVSESCMQL